MRHLAEERLKEILSADSVEFVLNESNLIFYYEVWVNGQDTKILVAKDFANSENILQRISKQIKI